RLRAARGEGGLPAQLAGGPQQGGVGDAGQENLAAGGVADDLRAVFAPPVAELPEAVADDGNLDAAAAGVGHEVGDVDRGDVGDLVQRHQQWRGPPPPRPPGPPPLCGVGGFLGEETPPPRPPPPPPPSTPPPRPPT